MAGNTIKGLTVSLGGDTTKLGKALENVNKRSRSLSKELGDINRMLKLDPGNVDLLAQKQRVLSDAIKNTEKRLDTLREAEAQVQEQFEKGEASEEQVRELRREIIAAEQRLKKYAGALEDTEQALKGHGKEAEKTEKDLDDLGDAAEKAEKKSSGLGKTLGIATKSIQVVGQAAAAIGAGLIGAAESSREYRTEMGKLDAAFTASGHSADTASAAYSTLYGVIGETDQSVEAAQQIALLAKSEKDVAKWSDLAAGVVGRFGDALQPETFFEAANETMKLGESTGAFTQMLEGCGLSVEDFNAGLAACTTEAEKQAYMLSVAEGALGAAGEAYKKNAAEIIRANQANDEWMKSLSGIGGAIDPVISDVKLLGASLLSELVPGVQQVAEAFRGMLSGDDAAAGKLGEALSGIITQLVEKVTTMLPQVVSVATSLITTLVSTLAAMLPQLLTTGVQIISTILSGLTQAIPQLTQALVSMIPQLTQALVSGIPQLIQGALQFFMAIVQAIPQLIPPLVAAIPQIVMSVINGLMAAIPSLITGAVRFFMAIVQAIPRIVAALAPQIPVIVTTIVNCLQQNIPLLLQAAIQLLYAIIRAIPQIIPPLAAAIPQIVNTLVEFLIDNVDIVLDAAIQMLFALIDAIPVIVDALVQNLPKIITSITTALFRAVPKVLQAGVKIFFTLIDAAGQLLAQLPSIMVRVITSIWDGLVSGVPTVLRGVGQIISTILTALGELPGKVVSFGADIVRGLVNGITDMVGWAIGKVKGFGDAILGGLKSFFGIASPSRLMRDEIGKNIAYGMAEGIVDGAGEVRAAMDELNGMVVNGPTLERNLQRQNTTRAAEVMTTIIPPDLSSKLDAILAAIEKGQVLLLDGKALVGQTANAFDNALGQRRALIARGAL